MAREKLEWKKVAFEPIARPACNHKIARIVSASAREREDVIERGGALIEMRRAVYTALTAIAQRGSSHRPFERRVHDAARAHRHKVPGP